MTTPSDDKPKEWQSFAFRFIRDIDGHIDVIWNMDKCTTWDVGSFEVIERSALTQAEAELAILLKKWNEAEREIERLRERIEILNKGWPAADITRLTKESAELKVILSGKTFSCESCETLTKQNEELKAVIEGTYSGPNKTLTSMAMAQQAEHQRRACEKKNEERAKEIERLEDLLGHVYEATLEVDTKSRIANNMRATPFAIRRELSALQDKLTLAKEALKKIATMMDLLCADTVACEALKEIGE